MNTSTKAKFMKFCFLLLLTLLTTMARADLLPPQASEVFERFSNNPRTFDRHDQWCEGRGVGTACQIPGTPFEGGGPGKCERIIHRAEYKIDLLCSLDPEPQIQRGLPDINWQAEKELCEGVKVDISGVRRTEQGIPCENQPAVFDRFCRGKEAGQSCTAELRVTDRIQNFEGVCRREVETKSWYFQGRRFLTRDTVQCQPIATRPPIELKAVGAWRKLLQ